MRPNFEQLHQDFRPMVLQMCLGFVKGDRDQAEDLAQEVFIKIWKNLPRANIEHSNKFFKRQQKVEF